MADVEGEDMTDGDPEKATNTADPKAGPTATDKPASPPEAVEEIGGPKGPDPTRFGDWSVNGRCIDF